MRALLSVYDKSGIVDLARDLLALDYELVSTGGTLAALTAAGLPVLSVSDVTGFPEILDGRVKTLHPAIHGGLLARRDDPNHVAALTIHHIVPVDLLVANLYPFAATIARPDVTLGDAIEQIDVGGPAMIRAAAKNYRDLLVVIDPVDYPPLLDALRAGPVVESERRALAAKAFAHVSAYDAVVAEYLRGPKAAFPREWGVAGRNRLDLRYGENPHQRAAAFTRLSGGPQAIGVLDATQLGGKELSFNNLLDADAAWSAIRSFREPAVAIIKHTIPCGLASRDALPEAFTAALAGDPVSAFGGIVALNRAVDQETAGLLADHFFEVVIAPAFEPRALDRLRRKKQLRLLALQPSVPNDTAYWDVRPIQGGLLVQEPDIARDDPAQWRVVTDRSPTAPEWRDLGFAWEVVRHVKSNAIVLAHDRAVVGIGSGQPNRLESVAIAVRKAEERAPGAVLAGDAFFPFRDGVDAAAAAGIVAIVQPGGSIRDDEVIEAANAASMAMVFTGTRHFRH
jgi:phosphoribosylaminoimidazolecarboxamide formyltransferase/IMP cyclohydrolase